MPDRTVKKTDSIAVLRNGGQFLPLPRFFFKFRLWYRSLPDSFWTTLYYILDASLGMPAPACKGTLAQSQIPVDPHESGKWIAILSQFPELIEVRYSDGRSTKGTEFKYVLESTEEQWQNFIAFAEVAYRSGYTGRDVNPEKLRALFAWRTKGKKWPLMPFWSTALFRILADRDDDKELDCWDDANWIARGFDVTAMSRPLSRAEFAEWRKRKAAEGVEFPEDDDDDEGALRPSKYVPGLDFLNGCGDLLPQVHFITQCVFHQMWVRAEENDAAPYIPAAAWETLPKHHPDIPAKAWPILRAQFREASQDDIDAPMLENEWLTDQWQQARRDMREYRDDDLSASMHALARQKKPRP